MKMFLRNSFLVFFLSLSVILPSLAGPNAYTSTTVGSTAGASITLTPDSGKKIYLDYLLGYNDKADTIELTSTLTGTLTSVSGNATVTGSGTLFLTELSVGDTFRLATSNEYFVVSAIASNTSLTASAVASNSAAAKVGTRILSIFGTAVGVPINVQLYGKVSGYVSKAVTVSIVDSTSACALTVVARNQ